MPISVKCRCTAAFEVPETLAGKTSMCPGCGTFVDISRDGRPVDLIEQERPKKDPEEELSPRELKRRIRQAFDGDIEPVQRTSGYRLGIAFVAVAMFVLPGLYVGLILGIAVFVLWHVTTNYTLFFTFRIVWAVLLYVGPVIVGVMLLGFMIKPLLARPSRSLRGRLVKLDREPVLAEFVAEIARAVHAPEPYRIEVNCEVNAFAGFGRGLFAVFGNKLTLMIGLPLVRGMSARQLAGVIAHEFGHFNQGAGMRLTYAVRSVNAWFARVVHERDSWDEALDEWCQESGLAGVIAWAVRGCVLITRGILWVFMAVGHGLSCFTLRQMEFDADRSEARLVGVRVFESTFRRLKAMESGAEEAHEILTDCWMKERYPDDFAALVVGLADDLTSRKRQKLVEEMEDERTGLFATHPCFTDRLESVERDDPRAVFDIDLPATALFRNLDKLAEQASVDYYRSTFGGGIQVTLRPTGDYRRNRD